MEVIISMPQVLHAGSWVVDIILWEGSLHMQELHTQGWSWLVIRTSRALARWWTACWKQAACSSAMPSWKKVVSLPVIG